MIRTKTFSDVDRAIDELSASIPKVALLEGHQLSDVELTTSPIAVPHKLGRRIQGYFVVGRDANAVVYDENEGKLDLSTNLYLLASASVTVQLWVY